MIVIVCVVLSETLLLQKDQIPSLKASWDSAIGRE